MADVTRWEMRYPISVHGENPWGPLPSPDGGWVTAADYLAALERVRVETLRELDKQLATAMELLDGDPAVIGLRKARRALARLINAATTGDTDD